MIRLYTDNMNCSFKRISATKYGAAKYIVGNVVALSALGLLFNYGYLTADIVGSVVIAIFFICTGYMVINKRKEVQSIGKR